MNFLVRKVHKYLSFFISLQLLLWTVSGIYFAFNKIEILPDSNGIPFVSNIDILTYEKINVSISHESEFAVAVAIFFFK